jgi:hypothetical protein
VYSDQGFCQAESQDPLLVWRNRSMSIHQVCQVRASYEICDNPRTVGLHVRVSNLRRTDPADASYNRHFGLETPAEFLVLSEFRANQFERHHVISW